MSKKQTERHILEKFVSNPKGGFRIASITNSETPDFKITTFEKKKISIELTRLINPELREKEQFRTAIVERARDLFRKKYSANLEVHVVFANKIIKCRRAEIDSYAKQILEIVEGVYVPLQNFEFRVSSKEMMFSNENFDSIFISNEFDFANWQTFGAYIVDKVNFTWLKDVIAQKEKNITKYGETFDENWLLLTSTFGTKSSAFHFDYINFSELQTKFNRVYIYKYFEDSVIEVK